MKFRIKNGKKWEWEQTANKEEFVDLDIETRVRRKSGGCLMRFKLRSELKNLPSVDGKLLCSESTSPQQQHEDWINGNES